MTEVAAPAGGMEKVLSELKCTMPEFIFLVVFWVGACVLASFIDPSYITESTPVVLLFKLTDYLPMATYISIVILGGFAAFKFRASLIGALSSVLSKLTRSKRR